MKINTLQFYQIYTLAHHYEVNENKLSLEISIKAPLTLEAHAKSKDRTRN
jgi:hypothetical protein